MKRTGYVFGEGIVQAKNDQYAAARPRGEIGANSYLTLYHGRGCILQPSLVRRCSMQIGQVAA